MEKTKICLQFRFHHGLSVDTGQQGLWEEALVFCDLLQQSSQSEQVFCMKRYTKALCSVSESSLKREAIPLAQGSRTTDYIWRRCELSRHGGILFRFTALW